MGCVKSRFEEMPVTGSPTGLKILPGSEKWGWLVIVSYFSLFFSRMCFDCWNNLKTPLFAQVSLPGANGAQAEREIFQLQWRRLQVSHLRFLICIFLSFLIFAISIFWNDERILCCDISHFGILQCQGYGWASLVQVEIVKSQITNLTKRRFWLVSQIWRNKKSSLTGLRAPRCHSTVEERWPMRMVSRIWNWRKFEVCWKHFKSLN